MYPFKSPRAQFLQNGGCKLKIGNKFTECLAGCINEPGTARPADRQRRKRHAFNGNRLMAEWHWLLSADGNCRSSAISRIER